MIKTLILVRHGHRDNSRRDLDNGLDSKGKDQAKAIKRFYLERFATYDRRQGLWLVSSPKLRCHETLAPLAKSLECSVDAHPGLDEQGARESNLAFAGRVKAFLQEWKASAASLTVLSSHGDWLPLAIKELLGISLEFKKGSWTELEVHDSQPTLRWAIPTFKHVYKL
jgi:broad specificity phosphatase PhoE